ncbi:MAG: hypothetical protein ACYCW6_13680 [Candidatus Xenobia bacterium]
MSDPVGSLFNGLIKRQLGPGGPPGSAEAVIRQIREDAWNGGEGTHEYTLPAVRGMYISSSRGSLPVLYVNGREVGYLHGGCDEQARAVKEMLPGDLQLGGHFANTAFYIDTVAAA